MKWKPVAYFPNYEVSDTGLIKNVKLNRIVGNTAKKTNGATKYKTVTLSHKGKVYYRYVHRIVAEAFNKNYNDRSIVRFRNSDSSDCRADNLIVRSPFGSVEDHKDKFRLAYKDKEQTCRNLDKDSKKQALTYGKTHSCKLLICGVLLTEGRKNRAEFCKLFPEIPDRTVRRAVKQLIDSKVVSITDKEIFIGE